MKSALILALFFGLFLWTEVLGGGNDDGGDNGDGELTAVDDDLTALGRFREKRNTCNCPATSGTQLFECECCSSIRGIKACVRLMAGAEKVGVKVTIKDVVVFDGTVTPQDLTKVCRTVGKIAVCVVFDQIEFDNPEKPSACMTLTATLKIGWFDRTYDHFLGCIGK